MPRNWAEGGGVWVGSAILLRPRLLGGGCYGTLSVISRKSTTTGMA